MMEIRPVRHLKEPQYPLKSIVALHPEILNRLPLGWQKSRRVAAAATLLAGLAFSLSGCIRVGSLPSGSPSLSPSASVTPSPSPTLTPFVLEDTPYGGVPLPPKMVSEDEALQMIISLSGGLLDNTKEYGLAPSELGKKVSYLQYNAEQKALNEVVITDSKSPIQIDMYNPEKRIGFEYLNDEQEKAQPSVFEPTGKSIHADKKASYVLVMDEAYQSGEEFNAEIKEQVESFLSWLKAEGII